MNRTKRKIFQTAVELFAKKGYENTGIEEITAVAGLAKGLFIITLAQKKIYLICY